MKVVGKYNLFKGISTVFTVGTPLITLFACSEFFIHKPETSISAAGVVAVLLSSWFLKDKIAEKFKMPSPFILATTLLIVILMIESIILPMKTVCITTMIMTGIDELTFKRIYKRIEALLPENVAAYKQFGFIFAKSGVVEGLDGK